MCMMRGTLGPQTSTSNKPFENANRSNAPTNNKQTNNSHTNSLASQRQRCSQIARYARLADTLQHKKTQTRITSNKTKNEEKKHTKLSPPLPASTNTMCAIAASRTSSASWSATRDYEVFFNKKKNQTTKTNKKDTRHKRHKQPNAAKRANKITQHNTS